MSALSVVVSARVIVSDGPLGRGSACTRLSPLPWLCIQVRQLEGIGLLAVGDHKSTQPHLFQSKINSTKYGAQKSGMLQIDHG